jgi:hypothetical protein
MEKIKKDDPLLSEAKDIEAKIDLLVKRRKEISDKMNENFISECKKLVGKYYSLKDGDDIEYLKIFDIDEEASVFTVEFVGCGDVKPLGKSSIGTKEYHYRILDREIGFFRNRLFNTGTEITKREFNDRMINYLESIRLTHININKNDR